jgi:hypothetical protein
MIPAYDVFLPSIISSAPNYVDTARTRAALLTLTLTV